MDLSSANKGLDTPWPIQAVDDGVSLLSGHHVLARYCNVMGYGVPYLTGPADFPSGRIKHSKYTERPTTLCERDDILVTVKGSGSGSIILADAEYCISRQLMAIRPKEWDTKFLFYSLLQNAGAIRAASAGLIPGLSRSDILEQQLPIPPISEQRAIANSLADVDALIDSLEALISKKNDLKQATKQHLLTGKIRLPGFHGKWETRLIGDLFSFKNGLNKAKRFFGTGTPIVNYMDVFQNPGLRSHHVAGKVEVSADEVRAYEVLQGDVFFTRTSETVEEIGVAAVLLDNIERAVFSGFLLRARPKENALANEYKKYCFTTREVREQIISRSSYTTRALTNGRHLSAVALPVPEMAEQIAIASVLADIDAEVARLQAERDKTVALKQGMMQALLTGRIRLK